MLVELLERRGPGPGVARGRCVVRRWLLPRGPIDHRGRGGALPALGCWDAQPGDPTALARHVRPPCRRRPGPGARGSRRSTAIVVRHARWPGAARHRPRRGGRRDRGLVPATASRVIDRGARRPRASPLDDIEVVVNCHLHFDHMRRQPAALAGQSDPSASAASSSIARSRPTTPCPHLVDFPGSTLRAARRRGRDRCPAST